MRKKQIGNVSSTGLWSAFIGGMVGFAAGLLFAPEEGQRTRRRLVYQLEHMAVRTALLVESLTRKEVDSAARRSSDALVADAQVRAQRIRDDIDALLEEMRDQQRTAQEASSASSAPEASSSSSHESSSSE